MYSDILNLAALFIGIDSLLCDEPGSFNETVNRMGESTGLLLLCSTVHLLF
jgi:hypothetical protein